MHNVLLLVPIFLFSLCVHEYAHAWVAQRCGDPTAKELGRLTLHPMAHADIVGTLVLPILCIYNGWPFFGWAKPVPVNPRYFKNPRREMALVAVAGPVSNVLLALISTAVMAFLIRIRLDVEWVQIIREFAAMSILINLILAAFNLIPVPPLDGSRVLQGILPMGLARHVDLLERYGFVILLALFFTGGLRYLLKPVYACFGFLLQTAGVYNI